MPGTVSCLIEMGIPAYMITSTIELILARLGPHLSFVQSGGQDRHFGDGAAI